MCCPPCAQPEPVQRGGDLLIAKRRSHLPHDLDRLRIRAPPASAGLTLLYAQFGMTPASPVNQQNNLSACLLHLRNDFADQNPHDPLLEPHVRGRRVPNRREILRQAQENLRIRHRCRLSLAIKLVQFVFKFFDFRRRVSAPSEHPERGISLQSRWGCLF